MRKTRVMLVSCAVILLCVCVIAGMSYALFTDSVKVVNHLKAGNLIVTLKRVGLQYKVLNSDGDFAVTTDNTELDLSDASGDNAFGIDSNEDILIVPGSYFDAKFEISNTGTTAFKYSVGIVLEEGYDESRLAEQLKVIVYDADGTTKLGEDTLSNMSDGMEIFDDVKMKVNDGAKEFSVRVEFIDDTNVNNNAKNGTVKLDLVVTAIQDTSVTPAQS